MYVCMYIYNNNNLAERKHDRNSTFKYQNLLIELFAGDQVTLSNTENNLQ